MTFSPLPMREQGFLKQSRIMRMATGTETAAAQGISHLMTPLVFTLPDRISVTEANALLPFLREHTEVPLELSAARLGRMDTLLAQTLLATAADRRARGIGFCVTDLTPDLAARLAALGVTQAQLSYQQLIHQGAA